MAQQSSQGYWSSPTIIEKIKTVSGLKSLNEESLKAEIAAEIGSNEDLIQKVVLTVIALWAFLKYF
jgi:hypothetical protein